MADVRWKDKPQLVDLAGTEVLAGTSIDGGAKVGGGTVAAGGDVGVTTGQILAAAAAAADDAIAAAVPPIRTETASYTAALGDRVVQMNVASANTFTVPPNADVAFAVGAFLEIWQQGAGQTTIVAGDGVTILSHAEDTLKLLGQNAGCSLRKVATNTWRMIGKMESA